LGGCVLPRSGHGTLGHLASLVQTEPVGSLVTALLYNALPVLSSEMEENCSDQTDGEIGWTQINADPEAKIYVNQRLSA
jgi:hypothetical protein